MLNSRGIDALMRGKEHGARSQPMRGHSHRRAPPSRTHSDGFFNAQVPGGNLWRRSFNGSDSYGQRGFDGGGDFADAWRSMSPSARPEFGNTTISSTPRSSGSGAYQPKGRMSFGQAIANIISALNYCNDALQQLESTFNTDIASLKCWLPTQHIESLWIIYTAWNGIPVTTAKNPSDVIADASETLRGSAATATTTTTTPPSPSYAELTLRISKALNALRHCTPPDELVLGSGPDGYLEREPELVSGFYDSNSGSASRLGWHLLRTAMRKLEISIEAIEELISLVRTHRLRMPALRHEVGAALQLLEGMRSMLKTDKTTNRDTTDTKRRRNHDEESTGRKIAARYDT